MSIIQHFINGQRYAHPDSDQFDCLSPATGEVFASVAQASQDDVNLAVSTALNGQAVWLV